MGRKITIDSSTMVNKGLEVMEAQWLFGVPAEKVQVIVQPQSIIHSMVEFKDGAVMAQLGSPDMRLPIQYALYYPERRELNTERLDFYELANITFEKPDMETFKGLKLAYEAAARGGNIPTALNAANEVAVARFLDRKIKYLDIPDIIEYAMNEVDYINNPTVEQILSTQKIVTDMIESRLVLNVFLAILVLSIIVIVHEFGHFIIAKANGITVVEFSIGFGPKLIHFRKGETEYCIKALPFGGACTMLGDEFLEMSVIQSEEDNDEELTDEEKEAKKRKLAIENGYDMEKSFASKSVWARIAVIAAGPVFNFLLAFVCAVVIVGSLGYDPCDIDVIKDNSPATEAGLQEGDVITKVNGHKVTFYRDFYFYRAYNADKTLNITFTRDGEKMTTTVTPQHIKQQKYQVGIMMNENCLISSVTKDSPAEKAGLKANDVIKAVDGTAMENSSSVTEAITSSGGSSVTFTVARDGKNVDVTVEPKMVEVESYDTGFVVYGDRVKTSPIGTLKYSVEEVGYSVKTVIQSLGMLFTGKIGFDSLLGPVGTVSTMSEIVEESKADGAFYVFLNLMNLAALISANLGVMNLLPIPALDGGRLVFLIIEALRGKPVKREHEGIVNFIGMILLVILMVVVLFKDIMALF